MQTVESPSRIAVIVHLLCAAAMTSVWGSACSSESDIAPVPGLVLTYAVRSSDVGTWNSVVTGPHAGVGLRPEADALPTGAVVTVAEATVSPSEEFVGEFAVVGSAYSVHVSAVTFADRVRIRLPFDVSRVDALGRSPREDVLILKQSVDSGYEPVAGSGADDNSFATGWIRSGGVYFAGILTPQPTVSDIHPAGGLVTGGTRVVIRGTNLGRVGATTVKLAGVDADVIEVSRDMIVCTARPSGGSEGSSGFEARVFGKSVVLPTGFTYYPTTRYDVSNALVDPDEGAALSGGGTQGISIRAPNTIAGLRQESTHVVIEGRFYASDLESTDHERWVASLRIGAADAVDVTLDWTVATATYIEFTVSATVPPSPESGFVPVSVSIRDPEANDQLVAAALSTIRSNLVGAEYLRHPLSFSYLPTPPSSSNLAHWDLVIPPSALLAGDSPSPRSHAAVAHDPDNDRLFIWGGYSGLIHGAIAQQDGAIYRQVSESEHTFEPVSTDGAPNQGIDHEQPFAVWTGSSFLVWCPSTSSGAFFTPGEPGQPGFWTSVADVGGPPPGSQSVCWAGDRLIVWKNDIGFDNVWECLPGSSTWGKLPSQGAPSLRRSPFVGWTGTQLVVFGGSDALGFELSDGFTYDSVSGWRPLEIHRSPPALLGTPAFSTALLDGAVLRYVRRVTLVSPVYDVFSYDFPSEEWSRVTVSSSIDPDFVDVGIAARPPAPAILLDSGRIALVGRKPIGDNLFRRSVVMIDLQQRRSYATTNEFAPNAYFDGSVVAMGSKIIAFGGIDQQNVQLVVAEFDAFTLE